MIATSLEFLLPNIFEDSPKLWGLHYHVELAGSQTTNSTYLGSRAMGSKKAIKYSGDRTAGPNDLAPVFSSGPGNVFSIVSITW